jgi:hypothetical protein
MNPPPFFNEPAPVLEFVEVRIVALPRSMSIALLATGKNYLAPNEAQISVSNTSQIIQLFRALGYA